jgi:micrococcal nuclease
MVLILKKFNQVAVFLNLLIISVVQAENLRTTIPVQVVHITDGDTIVVRLQGQKEKVRLSGIDVPECRPNPKAQKDAFRTGNDLKTIFEMGQRATRYVKGIISPGDQVEIELDIQQRDKYRRLLAYVWLQDGRMLNGEIVRAGYASLMTEPPNVKHLQRLQEAHREAQNAGRGFRNHEKQEGGVTWQRVTKKRRSMI